MAYYVAPGIISPVLEPPYIIYQNPTCKELSNNIAAREHPRAGSKKMTTYRAVAQTQSRWSSSCKRTSPSCGRKQMATYQAVAQMQSRCLIAARGRPRAGSKQMATYQAVVAQTQSSSASNLCCSVATQTGLLTSLSRSYTPMNAVWRTPIQPRPQTTLLLLLYIFSRTRSSSMLAALHSLPLFFPPLSFFL